jgi:hypothetical protein
MAVSLVAAASTGVPRPCASACTEMRRLTLRSFSAEGVPDLEPELFFSSVDCWLPILDDLIAILNVGNLRVSCDTSWRRGETTLGTSVRETESQSEI